MANIYDMVDTWNDGATTFTAIKMDVTDTASASGSLLLDLKVGGVTKASIDKNGNLTASLTAIDDVPIGASTPSTGAFTTLSATNITVTGTVDGRDVAADGTKLDGIEALADVTDTANVTAAGALMDSEVTNLADVKAFDPADYATAAQGSTADSALQPGDIGTSVQGYDADTLKADTADTLTAGFDSADFAAGTKSSGTYTPDPADGNFQVATNGGAHTLAPPATSCTIVIHYTNNGSAGAVTTSSYTLVNGDSLDTTDTNEFVLYITKVNDVSILTVAALQ